MGYISDTITALHAQLPKGVELVAVSKFHPVESLREAYDAGQRVFGESRVQELVAKIPQMPDDTCWHFIGHLQTNKVKQIIGKTSMIESVDSLRLLEIIDKLSFEAGVTTNVLLQVHVAAEETKFGFLPDELRAFFAERRFENLKATRIRGLMGMATNTDDMNRVAADFKAIASLKSEVENMCPQLVDFDVISMGMSDDYKLAIEAGSTHIRIGTAIFGNRYN